MTPKQLLAIVVARWRVAALAFLLTVLGTVGVSLLLFTEYTATATVMLDARSPEQIASGTQNGSLPGGYMATQVDLIGSERVARAVIRDLGLTDNPEWRDAWLRAGDGQGEFQSWLSDVVLHKLLVRPAPVSNVLNISYASRDPQDAARYANAFMRAYVDTSLEIRLERVREYGRFFDERAQQLRAALSTAQARLSEYQQKNGIVVGDDRLDVESARLSELSSQLLQLQGAAAEIASRQHQARTVADQMSEVAANPLVASLNADVAREETRLQELASRLGDGHPQMTEQRARVSELKARLAAATARASGAIGVNGSSTQARISQVNAALETQRSRVLRLQKLREQSAALQRDVENAKGAYDSMQLRVAQSSIESQNQATNVVVLKEASPPMRPSSPKVLKNIAAAVVGGAVLGIAAAIALEYFDRRLRTVEDLTELKATLLISLPTMAYAPASGDTSRSRLTKQRVLTGLPRPGQPG